MFENPREIQAGLFFGLYVLSLCILGRCCFSARETASDYAKQMSFNWFINLIQYLKREAHKSHLVFVDAVFCGLSNQLKYNYNQSQLRLQRILIFLIYVWFVLLKYA